MHIVTKIVGVYIYRMFYINDSGEMYLRQEVLPSLNTSVLHVVATAIDSGTPPRQVYTIIWLFILLVSMSKLIS